MTLETFFNKKLNGLTSHLQISWCKSFLKKGFIQLLKYSRVCNKSTTQNDLKVLWCRQCDFKNQINLSNKSTERGENIFSLTLKKQPSSTLKFFIQPKKKTKTKNNQPNIHNKVETIYKIHSFSWATLEHLIIND